MKQKYVVKVVERLVRSVCVSAESEAEAWEKTKAMYSDSEIVLTADDFEDVDIEVVRTLPRYLVKDEDGNPIEDGCDFVIRYNVEEYKDHMRKLEEDEE